MGLDMYIRHGAGLESDLEDESFETWKSRELCYWRKHPNLHGYIVDTYADGLDECQKIQITRENVVDILEASECDELPHTEGFFFGTSTADDKVDTREQLTRLLDWMEKNPDVHVYYQASW